MKPGERRSPLIDSHPPPPLTPPRSPLISSSSAPDVRSSLEKSFWAAGRPPWFDTRGDTARPFIVGVAGGTSSGKTTVCHRIVEELNIPWAVILSQDSFYKDLEGEDLERAERNEYNFDHPNAFDYDLMVSTLTKLKEGKSVQVPVYDFRTHKRMKTQQRVYGADVILFEGILVFWDQELLDLMDLKVFVQLDSDIRLARRLRRDIAERGRDFDGVLEQYERFVKPSFDDYIAPTSKHANIIVPNTKDNSVAIDVLVQHIRLKMEERGRRDLREELSQCVQVEDVMPPQVHVMSETNVTRTIHTEMRDKDTERATFRFQATRLTRLLVEYALDLIPFEGLTVTTPVDDAKYHGLSHCTEVIGVSIMRAGESMEVALREVVKDVILGKILIQSERTTGTPELIYTKLPLPHVLKGKHVLLMDPVLGTGATAIMAIRVLLDHDVQENHIMFLTLIAAPLGLHNVAYAFPEVTIVTTAVDDEIDDRLYVLPGVGNWGNRYFGTE